MNINISELLYWAECYSPDDKLSVVHVLNDREVEMVGGGDKSPYRFEIVKAGKGEGTLMLTLRTVGESPLTVLEGFRKLSNEMEDAGVPVSVCDSCEETYPEAWIMKNNICPYCLHPHNLENDKDFFRHGTMHNEEIS